MSSPTATIAFFGATGGCTNACLAHALKAGHHAVALARTPAKLTAQLLGQEGISQATLDARLRIVQGDATDPEAVRETILLPPDDNNSSSSSSSSSNGPPRLVPTIVSGIGGTPSLQRNSLVPRFTLDNPTVTEDTTQALLAALRDIYARYPSLSSSSSSSRPLLTVISTTGLSKKPKPNDVPLLFRPMYHTLLAVPHADKRRMETLLAQESSRRLFRGVVVVRPSLLVGDHSVGTGKGWRTLRVGTEEKPAVGYTIARADVGEWIFEEVVTRGGGRWVGQKVTLTS
ncbi:hypothetical protein VTN02DRAFT_431 [Thermoascus thermophilus]